MVFETVYTLYRALLLSEECVYVHKKWIREISSPLCLGSLLKIRVHWIKKNQFPVFLDIFFTGRRIVKPHPPSTGGLVANEPFGSTSCTSVVRRYRTLNGGNFPPQLLRLF